MCTSNGCIIYSRWVYQEYFNLDLPPVRADRPQNEGVDMSEARLSIRTDSALKEQARRLYESMGLDLTTAVNMFLRQSVVDHGMPPSLGSSTRIL